MRTAINHGPCCVCGANEFGLYWQSCQHVLDLGLTTGPIETWNDEPIRCDECEQSEALSSLKRSNRTLATIETKLRKRLEEP